MIKTLIMAGNVLGCILGVLGFLLANVPEQKIANLAFALLSWFMFLSVLMW